MRRILSMVLVFSLGVFFQIGCGGVGVRTQPSGAWGYQDYSSSWPDTGMNMGPFIGAAVVVAAAVAVVAVSAGIKAKHDRLRYALTPEGRLVQILFHSEAPEDAVLIGDVHTASLNYLDYVKNDLRNQTARLGGNLMVLDDIQQDIYHGRTCGYIGIGRAYKIKDRS